MVFSDKKKEVDKIFLRKMGARSSFLNQKKGQYFFSLLAK